MKEQSKQIIDTKIKEIAIKIEEIAVKTMQTHDSEVQIR